MMHDFELHEFFHSPKNVLLKALLYYYLLNSHSTIRVIELVCLIYTFIKIHNWTHNIEGIR